MEQQLAKEALKSIIARVLDNAYDAVTDNAGKEQDHFLSGKRLAYYEVLDTIKKELAIRDADLEEFGLNVILETML